MRSNREITRKGAVSVIGGVIMSRSLEREETLLVESPEFWSDRRIHSPSWSMSAHMHEPAELGLVLSGACTVTTRNGEMKFGPGNVYFVPGNEPHAMAAGEDGFSLCVVHFPASALPSEVYCEMVAASLLHQPFCLVVEDQERFSATCQEIIHETSSNQAFAEVICGALITQLAVILVRGVTRGQTMPLSAQGSIVRESLDWIHRRIHEPFSVGDLAKAVNVSPSHLRRVFASELGVSPRQYVNNLRLQRSKALLLNLDNDVTTVARMSGLSLEQFSRLFRRYVGCSPTEWRERHSHAAVVD